MWDKIALLLEQRGLTIAELSRETNIPATTIYTWRNAPEKRISKIEPLKKLAVFFGVNISELM